MWSFGLVEQWIIADKTPSIQHSITPRQCSELFSGNIQTLDKKFAV